jgi:hypothetical protein
VRLVVRSLPIEDGGGESVLERSSRPVRSPLRALGSQDQEPTANCDETGQNKASERHDSSSASPA